MPLAHPSMFSSFSSKALISVPLSWLSQSQLSPFTFPPRSLLEYQPPNSQTNISSQLLVQMCTSHLIPASSSITLSNLPLFQCLSQAVSILDLDMRTLLYTPVATCPLFCRPKTQLTAFSDVGFLSSPTFLPHSLFLPHFHASLQFIIHLPPIPFPVPPQLSGQTTILQRQDVKDVKQHILPLTFLSETALSLGCYLSKFSTSIRHQLWKSEAKTVKASQSYEQLNTRSHTRTCCAALTTHSATCLS